MNQLGPIEHCGKPMVKLASMTVGVEAHLKRPSWSHDEQRTKRDSDDGADAKDRLLCELELEQTVAAGRIANLEKIRGELQDSLKSFDAFYRHSPIGCVTLNRRGHIKD